MEEARSFRFECPTCKAVREIKPKGESLKFPWHLKPWLALGEARKRLEVFRMSKHQRKMNEHMHFLLVQARIRKGRLRNNDSAYHCVFTSNPSAKEQQNMISRQNNDLCCLLLNVEKNWRFTYACSSETQRRKSFLGLFPYRRKEKSKTERMKQQKNSHKIVKVQQQKGSDNVSTI